MKGTKWPWGVFGLRRDQGRNPVGWRVSDVYTKTFPGHPELFKLKCLWDGVLCK